MVNKRAMIDKEDEQMFKWTPYQGVTATVKDALHALTNRSSYVAEYDGRISFFAKLRIMYKLQKAGFESTFSTVVAPRGILTILQVTRPNTVAL